MVKPLQLEDLYKDVIFLKDVEQYRTGCSFYW